MTYDRPPANAKCPHCGHYIWNGESFVQRYRSETDDCEWLHLTCLKLETKPLS